MNDDIILTSFLSSKSPSPDKSPNRMSLETDIIKLSNTNNPNPRNPNINQNIIALDPCKDPSESSSCEYSVKEYKKKS